MNCKICGSAESVYMRKDEAHVGEYCATCGKWKKWISKAEQCGKQILDGGQVNTQQVSNNKGYTRPVNSACSDISDIPRNMESRKPDLQINIAPRGVTVVTVSTTGETIELTNISIRVNKTGVTICDVAGNQVQSYKFD